MTCLPVQAEINEADPEQHIPESDLLHQGQVVQQSFFIVQDIVKGDERQCENSHPKQAHPPEFVQANKSTGERYQSQQGGDINDHIMKRGKEKSTGKHRSYAGPLKEMSPSFIERRIPRKDHPETHQCQAQQYQGSKGYRPGGIGLPVHGSFIQQVAPIIVHPVKAFGILVLLRSAGIKKGGQRIQPYKQQGAE